MPRTMTSHLGPLLRRALTRANTPAVSDQDLAHALGVYVGMVDHVLTRPERWLGADPEASRTTGRGRHALQVVRGRLVGRVNPTSPTWEQLPLKTRVRWWVRRITLSAGTAAAAPRLAGLLADRVPLQDALGASASGMAVCAVAREHHLTEPADWVPLLSHVIFGRDLSPVTPTALPTSDTSAAALEAPTELPAPDKNKRVARAGQTLWHLAQILLELGDLFDERPRGGVLPRLVGKFPVVGLAGGWLDERGAIRRAARQTARLLTARS